MSEVSGACRRLGQFPFFLVQFIEPLRQLPVNVLAKSLPPTLRAGTKRHSEQIHGLDLGAEDFIGISQLCDFLAGRVQQFAFGAAILYSSVPGSSAPRAIST